MSNSHHLSVLMARAEAMAYSENGMKRLGDGGGLSVAAWVLIISVFVDLGLGYWWYREYKGYRKEMAESAEPAPTVTQ